MWVNDYKNQLLFAYRTILNERRKKELNISFNSRFNRECNFSDNSLNDELSKQNQIGIDDIDYYLNIILSDLENDTENFIFFERGTMPQGVCISSHFSYESAREQAEQIILTGKDFDILTSVFICYFPIINENVLIMGYLKSMEGKCGKWVRSFFEMEEQVLFKSISDLMLKRCEYWACSEYFYNNKILPREKQIQNILFENFASESPDDVKIGFSIFDNPS
jgi:hypothetical protein